jgi:O-antigen ligase
MVVVSVDISHQEGVINRSFSNRLRFLLTESAFSMFRDYPLIGVGSGNFSYRLPEYTSPELDTLLRQNYDGIRQMWYYDPAKKPDIELAHNVIVQVMAETGVAGTVGFMFLFGMLFRRSWRYLKISKLKSESIVRTASLSTAITLFVVGMFGWPFSHGTQEVLMIALGFAMSSKTMEDSW